MKQSDERLLWILAILLLLWWVFRRVGFSAGVSGALGPIAGGAGFGFATTGSPTAANPPSWMTCGGLSRGGPIVGDYGDYSSGGFLS